MNKWDHCSIATAVINEVALKHEVSLNCLSPSLLSDLRLFSLLTDSTDTKASLLGSALSRGGWKEL